MSATSRPLARLLCLLALAWGAFLPAFAAPYEVTVYTDEIAAPGETEVETLFSLARPRSGLGLPRRVAQMLVEVNHGIAKGWEIGLELPAVFTSQVRKTEGFAVEVQYIAPHDKQQGWFWGLRGDIGRQASIYEDDTAISLELNPILGYRAAGYRVVFNPSIEKNLSGNETATRFQPSAKLAFRAAPGHELGVEYYGNWGKLGRPLAPSRRDETLYVVWDARTAFGHLDLGLGRALRPEAGSVDRWVVKLGLQFELDD